MVSCRHCVDAAAAAAGGIWLERYRQQPIRARACLASAHLSDTACQAAPCRSVPRSGGAAVRASVAGPRYAGAQPALDRTPHAGWMSSSPRPNSAPSSLQKPTRRGFEETRHFLLAQHDRRLARLVHDRQRANEVRPFERHGEKEPQRGDRGVDGPWADLLLGQMQLISAKILARGRGRRTAE